MAHRLVTAMSLFCSLSFFFCSPGYGDDNSLKRLEGKLTKMTIKIAPTISNFSGNVCVADFTTRLGKDLVTSEFGQAAADYVTSELVNYRKPKKYTVIDRKHIVRIMQDSIIFGEDTDQFDRLRKKAGMNILIAGSHLPTRRRVKIELRVVNAETGEVLASENCVIRKNDDIVHMLSRTIPLTSDKGSSSKKEIIDTQDWLFLDVGIYYQGVNGKLHPIRDGMVLSSNDNYCIYVKPSRDCYLYVYQVDSTKRAFKLFPSVKYKTEKNPAEAGTVYWIPSDKRFFFLDENIGREEIYVFATQDVAPQLANITEATGSEFDGVIRKMGVGGTRGLDVVREVKPAKGARLELISKEISAKGNFCYKLSFWHK